MSAMIRWTLTFSRKVTIIPGMTESCTHMGSFGCSDNTSLDGLLGDYLPYAGWLTIVMTEKPVLKYLLIGALGLLVVASKE
ncbi:Peptidase S24/S26A/S26B/S26C family protein [Zea mays]|uniref:Peptidase S24/S26A/S26B/S26C family protein n=1 Tax=Zea mays TaxID=4577 RepID=A0A1D6KP14_MAIZE|nr:Peptidase S24/S26A/S26B/S26C family protein [Zea mays]ONM04549.1 Peptidase S24/S26A/S26B/S26C family protein [Zea mays]